MSASSVIFYLIAAFVLTTGLLAVTTRKIFRAAIWLLFSLIGIAGLYFWMDAQFIAAVQIVVYVGGIVVLIIFSIFLTQRSGDELPKPPTVRLLAGAGVAVFGFALAALLIVQYGFTGTAVPRSYNVNAIGTRMLATGDDGFALPFEVVSILLLAALIGCIVIAMRKPKAMNPSTVPEINHPADRDENTTGVNKEETMAEVPADTIPSDLQNP